MKNYFLIGIIVFLSLRISAQVPSYVDTTDLKGWWSFNGNTKDLSGHGNNFTNSGAILTTDRNNDTSSAYSFNGTNQFMEVKSPSFTFSQTGDFSISIWLLTTNGGDAINSFTGANGNFVWIFGVNSKGISTFGANNVGGTWTWVDAQGKKSKWEHFVLTYSNGAMSTYINGVQEKTGTHVNSIGKTVKLPLTLGHLSGSTYFDGKADDIGVWNRALSHGEIWGLYSGLGSVSHCANNYNLANDTTFGCSDTVSLTLSGSDVRFEYLLLDTVSKLYAEGPIKGTGRPLTFKTLKASKYKVITKSNISNSLKFDGSNDYVAIDSTAGLPLGNAARTMECWMKTTASGTKHRVIFDYGDRTIDNNRSSLQMDPNGRLYFSGYHNDLVGKARINDGKWHHVAVTHDGKNLTLYVDGKFDATKKATLATSGDLFKIGVDNKADSEFFDGEITKVRIWNASFNIGTIQQLKNTCLVGNEANLVAAYNFTSASSSTLIDDSKGFKNGILTNMDTIKAWQVSRPFVVSNTVVVIQNKLPNPNLGNDTLMCANASMSFSPGNFASYLWSDASTSKNLTINGDTTGTGTFSYYVQVTDSNGCKSIDTVSLQVNDISSSNDAIISCDSLIWMDGKTYYQSNNTATHTLTNVFGCDSVITLDLTINSVDNGVSISGNTITSNAVAANYQWIDCKDSSLIDGETDASFTSTINGYFAVEVTLNGCVDTSECVSIAPVGLQENLDIEEFILFPNPTEGNVALDFNKVQPETSFKLYNGVGQLIETNIIYNSKRIELEINGNPGIYFLQLIDSSGKNIVVKIEKR